MNQLNSLFDKSASTDNSDHSPFQKKSKIDLSLPSEKVSKKKIRIYNLSNRMCTRSFYKPFKPNNTQAIEIRPLTHLTNQNQSDVITNVVKSTQESRVSLMKRLMGPK